METQTLAINQNWLDNGTGTTTGVETTTTGTYTSGCLTYYQPWYYPVYMPSPARPIKLTLGEVERLRKAAKADDKLKAILQKFTDQIEITVAFD